VTANLGVWAEPPPREPHSDFRRTEIDEQEALIESVGEVTKILVIARERRGVLDDAGIREGLILAAVRGLERVPSS
jgi:hypothetical protein